LTTFLVCEAIYSFGQPGNSFKLYQNTDIFPVQCTNLNPRETTKQVKTNFSRISVAFVLHSKKNYFHEIELMIPEFSKPMEKLKFPMNYRIWKADAYDETGSSFSFRYELGKLLAEKSKPVDFLLSAGLNPYFVQLEHTPTNTNGYYNLATFYGVALNVTPRLHFRLNQRFSIDLNAPIRIYNLQVGKYRQDNPILPIEQQRRTEINHLFFEPVYTIRLGLMYSLAGIQP